MNKQTPIEPEYDVMNSMNGKKEFTGSVEECTQFMLDYGMGWSFLYIKDYPAQKKEETVRFINNT